MIGNALLILCNSSNDNSLSVTKPSPFAEVVNAEIPVCATKVKKERVAKSRKAKTDDPSQNKLMFPSAVAGTEGIVKKEIIPVQTALNFPTEKRKRARKTAKHDFSFSVEVNSVSSDDDDDDFSPQKIIARKKPQGKKQAVEEIPKPVSVTAVKKRTKTRKEVTANKETKESVSSINKPITEGPTKKTKPFEVAVKRPAPVAYSKRPTKIIKYYFSSDEDDD